VGLDKAKPYKVLGGRIRKERESREQGCSFGSGYGREGKRCKEIP